MQSIKYFLLQIFFLLPICFAAQGQQAKPLIDSIADLIEKVGTQKPATTLFVHFDKTIYSNNENVWFTGYLLKNSANVLHHTLSVALIRNNDRSVLIESKYVMDSGIAMCNMILPDSLPIGDYNFVCYTNQLLNNYPTALFVQPVTIKSNKINSFIAKLNFIEPITPDLDTARILLRATNKDGTLVKKAITKYFMGSGIISSIKGNLQTDNFGEATIYIPLKGLNATDNILHVEIENGNEIKNLSIKLPVYIKRAQVKFYPEGGNLIAGCKNTVGWEVIDSEGEPLQINATLFKNDSLIQTISSNEYGMGTFFITPETGSTYYVKLKTISPDILHFLPLSLQNGTMITVPHALSADTLYAYIQSKGAISKLNILVHNYRSVFINYPIISSDKPRLLKIPLNEIPKGINTITILDSAGRPLVERLFFAHYDKRAIVTIKTDSALYNTRQKVTVKYNVTDVEHQPLLAQASIACVQNSRFETKKTMDIESYLFLINELAGFTFTKNIMNNEIENVAYLEHLFLVKGWRRYTWRDVEMAKVTAEIPLLNSMQFIGKVTINNQALKKPVQLNLKKFITQKLSELEYVFTDSQGKFELPTEKIISEPNRKYEITVKDERSEIYRITVADPSVKMNKELAISLHFNDYTQKNIVQTSLDFVLPKNEVAKTLETVVVTSKKGTYKVNDIISVRGPNACGDYVCPYGILNCTNHFYDGVQPIVGNTYMKRVSFESQNMEKVYYRGCLALEYELQSIKESRFSMEGIYSKKEFYVTDFSKSANSEPQYVSTIYWNHAVVTDKNGASELTFYTGDITGKFRIVIQGITSDNDVLYGEHFFEVKEP